MYENKLIATKYNISIDNYSAVEIDYSSIPNYNPDVAEAREYFYIESQIDTKHILVKRRINKLKL